MDDFRQMYCIIHGCQPEDFSRLVFCHCLSRKALLPGRWLLFFNSLQAERELIEALGRTTSLARFHEELHYFTNRRSLGWWRRKAGLRMSTRRLRSLGEACFAKGSVDQRAAPMEALYAAARPSPDH